MAQKQSAKKKDDKQIWLIIFAGCLIYLAIKFILYTTIILTVIISIGVLMYYKNPKFKINVSNKVNALLTRIGLKKKTGSSPK